MNERIKQLANDAGLLVHNPNGVPTKLEKFAELIIKECADWVDEQDESRCPWSRDLLRHFGVKE